MTFKEWFDQCEAKRTYHTTVAAALAWDHQQKIIDDLLLFKSWGVRLNYCRIAMNNEGVKDILEEIRKYFYDAEDNV